MTAAEYRTMREACGLLQQAAAEFHDVALRTIGHWGTGRNPSFGIGDHWRRA